MAWERRGKKQFYYRSIRSGGKTKKVYCGSGALGRAAAELDERRREENQGLVAVHQATRMQVKGVEGQSRHLTARCQLLAEAVLLVSGFHRHKRMAWRRWHAARRRAIHEPARTLRRR
jgi:hypothetical protein